MNFNFLPQKIKDELKGYISNKIPVSVARTSGSVEGESGEGYVVSYGDKVMIFSRKTGQDGFIKIEGGLGKDIKSFKLRKEGFNIFLDADISGKPYSIKFSSFEEGDLKKIANAVPSEGSEVENVQEVPLSEPVQPAPQTTEPVKKDTMCETKISSVAKVRPMVLLASSMMFISKSDSKVTKEEDFYIISTMSYDKNILNEALIYYKSHSFKDFLRDVKALDEMQRLCVLSNMIEISMRDGAYSAMEQKMINEFVSTLAIEPTQFETIKQVLLIKNQISCLQ